MNDWLRTLLLLLAFSTATFGCRRSPTSHHPAPADLPAAPSELTLAATEPGVPSGGCASPVGDEAYGFYRTDPFAAGDVVLTFDDGPHPTATPRVLDLLAQHHMTATFFLIGRAIHRDTYPLVQRMVAEGHSLGSHSYSHDVKMTRVDTPDATIDYIQAQHEVTLVLIDIAMMASSPDDFDAMYERVFGLPAGTWLPQSALRKEWRGFVGRHRDLLAERSFSLDARPYPVVFSRPPGGGPYVEQNGAAGRRLYDAALERLGLVNVLWHGASGDTDPERRSDFAYLTDNLKTYSRHGGVLLIHDYIRTDALTLGLERMAADPTIHVIPLENALQQKYRCSASEAYAELHPQAPSV